MEIKIIASQPNNAITFRLVRQAVDSAYNRNKKEKVLFVTTEMCSSCIAGRVMSCIEGTGNVAVDNNIIIRNATSFDFIKKDDYFDTIIIDHPNVLFPNNIIDYTKLCNYVGNRKLIISAYLGLNVHDGINRLRIEMNKLVNKINCNAIITQLILKDRGYHELTHLCEYGLHTSSSWELKKSDNCNSLYPQTMYFAES